MIFSWLFNRNTDATAPFAPLFPADEYTVRVSVDVAALSQWVGQGGLLSSSVQKIERDGDLWAVTETVFASHIGPDAVLISVFDDVVGDYQEEISLEQWLRIKA